MHTEESSLSQIKEDTIMAKSSQGPQGTNEESKQPFVSQEDRPEVRINLDTPLNELRVRDLSTILALLGGKDPFESPSKAFFDKDFPEGAKDWMNEKPFKPEKPEGLEKHYKTEKPEKYEKYEKYEKPEVKEIKNEKLEREGVVFEPRGLVGPDPRMEQVIQGLQ